MVLGSMVSTINSFSSQLYCHHVLKEQSGVSLYTVQPRDGCVLFHGLGLWSYLSLECEVFLLGGLKDVE